MSDENLAPQEREWLTSPEATVREALRDTVGDGDGLDERVFDALIARAKVEALREAAEDLDESTQADVNNYIDRPSPTFSHSERYADVLWLNRRADQIEATNEHP